MLLVSYSFGYILASANNSACSLIQTSSMMVPPYLFIYTKLRDTLMIIWPWLKLGDILVCRVQRAELLLRVANPELILFLIANDGFAFTQIHIRTHCLHLHPGVYTCDECNTWSGKYPIRTICVVEEFARSGWCLHRFNLHGIYSFYSMVCL